MQVSLLRRSLRRAGRVSLVAVPRRRVGLRQRAAVVVPLPLRRRLVRPTVRERRPVRRPTLPARRAVAVVGRLTVRSAVAVDTVATVRPAVIDVTTSRFNVEGRQIEYQPQLAGGKGGNVTSARWQVTLLVSHMAREFLYSGEECCEHSYTPFTLLYFNS